MEASVDKPQVAWQPLTARGVAAFARESLGRLLLVQLVVALVAGGAVAWVLQSGWFPVIREAIERLPAQGEIHSGRLVWPEASSRRLAEGRLLALEVDLQHEGEARSPAHVQVEFGQADFKVISLFGYLQGAYPRGWIVAFNRPELKPWWGAWSPVILAVVIGLVVVALMLVWPILATVYCGPVWLIGFYANRELTLRGSWRLAGAALMPGALFLTAAIILYGIGAIDLIGLIAAAGFHFVLSWGYLVTGSLAVPPLPQFQPAKSNPFVPTSRPAGLIPTAAQNGGAPKTEGAEQPQRGAKDARS